ncbi:MAG TPA: GNAT family N-acetyltransferase [Ktedonobacterales bacterium]|nr:GNAT family N-acetyltransferase [Ktedonobacterales bacterium]
MTLRPFDDSRDRPLLRAWLADPQVARWLTGHDGALTEADLDAWRDQPDATRWVYAPEGVPLGYGELLAFPAAPYVRVARVLVDPARRIQGHGRALALALAAEARTRHPDWPIYTRITPDNHAALLAYPSVGFVALEPLPEGADDAYLWLVLMERDDDDPGGPLGDE